MKKNFITGFLLLFAVTGLFVTAYGKDDEAAAAAAFQKGVEAAAEKDYVDAAEYFAKAEFLSRSVDLKFRAARSEAESYRAAGYRGKEFEALEKLIQRYPTRINYAELVDREYAIGDAYFHGYADPAFWSLRFIPWLTDVDRMVEVYEAALKHAPFAPAGANARLRLAIRCLENNQNEKALKLLREVVRIYPESKAARYALLELGNALSELSLAGDGDGKYFSEALSVFQAFRDKYKSQDELEWVDLCENRARAAYAQRLHNIAEFYYREGENEPAAVYLLEVMRRFPNTPAAGKSEKLLTKLDKSYFPEQLPATPPPEYHGYELMKFPQENRRLLLAPENSNGKFLLPIYDLNLNKENKQ